MTKRQIYKKFTNLSDEELHAKNNKKTYVRNDVILLLLNSVEEKKQRGIRAIDGFRNKLMIPDSEIPKCPEFQVKSKIGKIFKKHNPLEEYSVKIYKIDPYFCEHCKYILLRIDIYFSECFLAVEIDEKGHTDRDIIFEEKIQKALEKKLGCKFIRIQVMQKMVMI